MYHPGSNITQEALSDVVKLQQSGAPSWLVIAVTPKERLMEIFSRPVLLTALWRELILPI